MYDYNSIEFSSYDWLQYFSSRSNHWVLRYWRNNGEAFFNRFTIISDRRLFIIGDKDRGNTYEFRKPSGEAFVQLNMMI